MYIFTDITGTIILDSEFNPEWLGDAAEKHRKNLSSKLRQTIISWSRMGGDNPFPIEETE